MTDATLLGLPLLYIIGPLVVFGPILFFVAYSLGLGGLFRKSEGPAIAGGGAERRVWARTVRAARDGAWYWGGALPKRPCIAAYVGMAVLYVPFVVFIGIFANGPAHTVLSENQALVKLSLAHAGERVAECRRLTREELENLPPNMRTPMKCARERWPVTVTFWLDGRLIYETTATPSGLSDDGPSVIYETFAVPAGRRDLRVRLLDSQAPGTPPYEGATVIEIEAGQVLAIGFDETTKAITFR